MMDQVIVLNQFLQNIQLTSIDNRVKGINLCLNSGQTFAMDMGIRHSTGSILIFLDGDLENFPSDIPFLLEEFNKGFDLVCGWRKDRWDSQFFSRKVPSVVVNKLFSNMFGLAIHDIGCTLKICKRSFFDNVYLTGSYHRFIPILLKSILCCLNTLSNFEVSLKSNS